MSLRLKRISRNSKDINELKRLYSESFPVDEQLPFWILLWKSKKEFVDFFAFYDNHQLVGFTFLIYNTDLTFVLYLAIDDKYRSKGYGSMALSKIKEYYPDNRIVLNIELVDDSTENYEQRLRRKKFYLKNGFKESALKMTEANDNSYEVLINGSDITKEEYYGLYKKFIGRVLYRFAKPVIQYFT